MKTKYLFVIILTFGKLTFLFAQSDFYVSQRYAKHFLKSMQTGRAEVAYFAIQLSKQDSCINVKQYGYKNQQNRIIADSYKIRTYCWNSDLEKYTSSCTRAPQGGLFKHQHSEGEEWIQFDEENQLVQLKRCGWAKAINRFIEADSSSYFAQF